MFVSGYSPLTGLEEHDFHWHVGSLSALEILRGVAQRKHVCTARDAVDVEYTTDLKIRLAIYHCFRHRYWRFSTTDTHFL